MRALPGLGDILCLIPALRALRGAFGAAHMRLVGLPAAGWLIERFPDYVDELVAVPPFPGLPETGGEAGRETKRCSQELAAFVEQARSWRLDLALQLHGSGPASNRLTHLLGASVVAGSYQPPAPNPDPARFNRWEGGHEIDRLLAVTSRLGVASQGRHLEWRDLGPGGGRDLLPGGDPLVVVHPGASLVSRRWPADCFAAVTRLLACRGVDVAVTGSAVERPLTRAVAAGAAADGADGATPRRGRVVDLAGRTDLDALAGLLRRARLLVCNDTGVSHLAAALGTPSVVVFSGSDLERWAPLDRQRHRAIQAGSPGPTLTAVVAAVIDQLAGSEQRPPPGDVSP